MRKEKEIMGIVIMSVVSFFTLFRKRGFRQKAVNTGGIK